MEKVQAKVKRWAEVQTTIQSCTVSIDPARNLKEKKRKPQVGFRLHTSVSDKHNMHSAPPNEISHN